MSTSGTLEEKWTFPFTMSVKKVLSVMRLCLGLQAAGRQQTRVVGVCCVVLLVDGWGGGGLCVPVSHYLDWNT